MKKLTVLTAVLLFISCDMITNDLQKEVDILRDQTEQLQEDVTTLQEEINSLEESNTETEAEMDSLETQLLLLSTELTILGSEVDSTDSELSSLIESLQTQIELLQAQIAALQFRFKEYQIAFYRYTSSGVYLCFMDPENPENIEKVFQDERLHTNTLSWAPDGNRLVVGIQDQLGYGVYLHIYDVLSGTLENIVPTTGISWMTAWSPKGDWIAYVDDKRFGSAADELVLVNPDTKEVKWFGDRPLEKFRGHYPSWDPTGERIALGNTTFYNTDSTKVRRIAIFSDLWGEPKRTRLHTEETLQNEIGEEADLISEGGNGVAWSPDGILIAYNVVSLEGSLYNQKIFIAKADGSGIVNILPYEKASFPTWSPDSQFLVFMQQQPNGKFHICRVNRDGGEFEDLSIMSSSDPMDNVPKWAN